MQSKTRYIASVVFAALLAVAAIAPRALAQEEKSGEKEQDKQSEQEPKKKKKSSKPRKPRGHESVADEFTRKVVSRVMREFKSDIEGRSTSSLREIVDDKKFYDYPRFVDELDRLFRSSGEMRFYTRLVSVETKEDRAVAVVELELAFVDRLDPSRRENRRERVTFDFHRTPVGWKIIEIKPRTFFFLD